MQRVLLQSADQISDLIERTIAAVERSPNFGGGVIAFVADAIDEEVDALLRRHLFKMEAQRKDDARAAMHAPKERTDLFFRLLLKLQIPKQQLPIERVAFSPERRAEQASIWFVARSHEPL